MSAETGKTVVRKAVKETFTLDGKTAAFTLTYAPESNEGFLLFADGSILCEGVDYTLSGKTLNVPPISLDPNVFPLLNAERLWAQYWAEFSI